MLKALKPDTFVATANAKCGEVYLQSLHSYRIDCAFCDMKSFVFADFLLHIQNEHFEHELLKTERLVLPTKQEQLDDSSSTVAAATTLPQVVNPFTWYEVANDDDGLADDSENETKEEHNYEEEDPVDVSSSAISIMKWDASKRNGRETLRHTRALKVDYNEESELDELAEQLDCTQCDKSYQNKKLLERHIQRQHKLLENTTDDHDDDYKPSKLPPTTCHKCEHCDKVYQGKYTLRQHVKRDHAEINMTETFICLECNVQLPRLRLLDEHVLKMHGGAPCVMCGRRYKTRHELKRHQLKHTNERNVACNHPGCEKRFLTTRHMRNHSKVHSEHKNFVCESCGYSCRNKETLRVHLRSHTGERPFGCKVCDKRFPSHSGLREHMAMHSTERPHICKVCGATFSRQKGLYHHKFLHAETKQFICKLCGNAYAQAAGLAGHMRKHRNDELNA
ncbi:hypothetical protein KR093_002631 [Drosophila rubida]|uniref:C2H2-type domain-containing protein n=1 Tax=Drosophila rubida TaxID=30044 RepID=A0AAD4PR81_9MUSC|nr:hypothetical protein KR093_002631 [Drosophila rubida]